MLCSLKYLHQAHVRTALSHLLFWLSFSSSSSTQRCFEFRNGWPQLSQRGWVELGVVDHPAFVFLILNLGTTAGWSLMGERGLEARQTQVTEEHMQRVLLVSTRVREELGLSTSSTMDSVSEDRGSREEESKMVSRMGGRGISPIYCLPSKAHHQGFISTAKRCS